MFGNKWFLFVLLVSAYICKQTYKTAVIAFEVLHLTLHAESQVMFCKAGICGQDFTLSQ